MKRARKGSFRLPKDCPLVVCGECANLADAQRDLGMKFPEHLVVGAVVELTDLEPVLWIRGVSVGGSYDGPTTFELRGWDVVSGEEHWVLDPRPLTPAGQAMLAEIAERSKRRARGD